MTVTPTDEGKLNLEFVRPQRAITPGQICAFYEGGTLLGGGVFEQVELVNVKLSAEIPTNNACDARGTPPNVRYVMKLTTLATITGLALAATAQAGEEASAKQVIAPIAALCDWSWFAGGSVGVIDGDDWDEDIYTLHIGKERKCAGDKCSQAIYLEVGFTESD